MCSSIEICNLDFLASTSFVGWSCRMCEYYYRLVHHFGDCFLLTGLCNDWYLLEVSCQIPGYQNISMKNQHRMEDKPTCTNKAAFPAGDLCFLVTLTCFSTLFSFSHFHFIPLRAERYSNNDVLYEK